MKQELILIFIFLFILLLGCTSTNNENNIDKNLGITESNLISQDNNQNSLLAITENYNPVIVPERFSANITNNYFSLVPGTKFIYEGVTEDGVEHVETFVTSDTRTVMGVTTRVVLDRVWLNDVLIEDTNDWYAQDNFGNVWYFGEESKEMFGNTVINTSGSWEAGLNGALPGIVMPASPKMGDEYRQEYFKGIAEDAAEIISLDENIDTNYGKLNNCLKTQDFTPLEPNISEHKYYCPEIGFVAYEINLEDNEKLVLLSIELNSAPSVIDTNSSSDSEAKISESAAKEIALREVSGTVTNIGIETKYGKTCYVIEVTPNNGTETDVIIDIHSGVVLGIET